MGLIGEQRKLLCEALMDAFPEKKDLEMMLSYHLDWKLNQIADGGNHSELVFRLISHAESQGKLSELLEAAIIANIGNHKLQQFKNTCSTFVTQDEIDNFKKILQEKEIDFKLLKNCYIQTLPPNAARDNIELYEPKDIDDIINNLNNYSPSEDNSNVPSVIKWIIKIVNNPVKNPTLHQKLKNILNPILLRLNIEITHSKENLESEECDSHLALIIRPEREKFCLEAVCIQGDSIRPLDYVPKNKSKLRRGILCLVEDIPKELGKIIEYFLENINDGLRIIEIYLPYQILYTDVDNWHIVNDAKQSVPILRDFDIVIHASDRITGNYNFRYLKDGWNNLENVLSSKPNSDIIQQNIETVNRTDKLEWQQIENNLKDKIGMKLAKPLLDSKSEQEKFIQAILNGGVPFAFWLKCKPSRNRKLEHIDCYLTSECLNNNLQQLIKHVYEMRSKAYRSKKPEQDLGYHLGFLCDIPDKITKIKQLQSRLELK